MTPRVALTALVASWALSLSPAPGGDSARKIAAATDIVDQWEPTQRLWVKGDVGLADAALARLEKWLDNEAPNWTVVVLQDASGETFRAVDGRNHSGMDAVEYALGSGLPNRTRFDELRDKRTGEKNGASFAIFLKERKFSYAAADAFDARGLGEDHWVGHLDRPAFRAMSNGGRVADAVMGTVAEIEGRLTRAISVEQRRRQEQAMRAERRRAEASALVEAAAVDVEALATEAEKFLAAHEGVVGDLARPKVAHWRSQAESAGALLEAGREAEAISVARGVSDYVRAHRGAVERHGEAGLKFEDLNRAIAELNPARGGWGATQLEEARRMLARSEVAHARGESAYEDDLRGAEAAYLSAREEIASARAELERRVESERQLVERAQEQSAAMRRGALGGGLALGGGVAATGLLLNRRRKPFKQDALTELERWKAKFGESRDRLFKLLDRANLVVGSEEELERRGHSGETERLSREVIADVDRLFVMSSSVDRVIQEAVEQAEPRYGFQRLQNLFGTARYRKAVALLKDLPITFKQGEGVRPVRRDDGDERRPLGRVESQEGFALTFSELVGQFGALGDTANAKLDRIESAWAGIDSALAASQAGIEATQGVASRLAEGAASDGLFAMEGVSVSLLPTAQAALDEAIATAKTDPVGALEEPLPLAERIRSEGAALCEIVGAMREERLPAIGRDGESLRSQGRQTDWIGRELSEASAAADELVEAIVRGSTSEEIAGFGDDLVQLREDVSEALELSARASDRTGGAIGVAESSVRSARESIAQVLQIQVGEVLHEEGLDPDIRIGAAKEQHTAGLAALDRGGVLAARAAFEEAEGLCEEAQGIVEVSQRSLAEHESEARRRAEEHAALVGQVPEHQALVDEMLERYEPEALVPESEIASDEARRDVGDLLRFVADELAAAVSAAERADQLRRLGKLIGAAGALAESSDALLLGRDSLTTIREHRATLRKLESENANRREQLAAERVTILSDCEDRRARRATITFAESLARDLDAVLRAADSPKLHPAAQAAALSELDSNLERAAAMLSNDRELHAEAGQSVAEVGSHLAVAKRLSHKSTHDDIPDSRRTLELQEEIEKLLLAGRAVERRLRLAHEDWAEIDVEADRISLSAGRCAAELRGELERAQAAVASLAAASTAVRESGGWTGSYGVRVEGMPGSNELHRAREFLLSGRYLETRRVADDARRAARHALALARSEVARRRRAEQRRAEQRRAEAARRRRKSRSSSSFGGFSSSSGGSRGSSSRSSSSSGSRRSSFRSSSGMSRSGW